MKQIQLIEALNRLEQTGYEIIDVPKARCADCPAEELCIDLESRGANFSCESIQSAQADTLINRAYLQ